MKSKFLILVFLPLQLLSQKLFTVRITASDDTTAIPSASVIIKENGTSAVSDNRGYASFPRPSSGTFTLTISAIGFERVEKTVASSDPDSMLIQMQALNLELEEVFISSTRFNRNINTNPTRVEVLGEEEVREEASMRPGDIRMLLAESTGIQTQQTSATSANASIRIQGLDGRYTQILKDGFPVYAGAASGLGLLQTPPLDLRQVEIIKGSASTLYGGGAIAGLVNLISKVPTEKRELNFNINITSAGGTDISGFYGQKFKHTGITMFVSRNSNKAYNHGDNDFSAIPEFERYTINPKLFLDISDKSKLTFAVNTSFENRIGGDMKVINSNADNLHRYFERNKTTRLSSQLSYDVKLSDNKNIKFKNSIAHFDRILTTDNYLFEGTQLSSFTELTFLNHTEKSDWVAGLNVVTDRFDEFGLSAAVQRDYMHKTFGAFAQNTLEMRHGITLETGLRIDHVKDYGTALLPRISAMFKISNSVKSRIGGGLGYKVPTIFTEETERVLYKNISPVNPRTNVLERSYGINWDVDYKTTIGEIGFTINQLFFFTIVRKPLFLASGATSDFLENIQGHATSKGAETNVRISYNNFALYLGYTFVDAKIVRVGVKSKSPLSPKHRLNASLIFELEDKWKIGAESYFFGHQKLTDGSIARSYWLSGFIAERLWSKFSLFINFENFGDVRQTKYESIYSGTITNPVFRDIYMPLEGFVVNGGIKLKL